MMIRLKLLDISVVQPVLAIQKTQPRGPGQFFQQTKKQKKNNSKI